MGRRSPPDLALLGNEGGFGLPLIFLPTGGPGAWRPNCTPRGGPGNHATQEHTPARAGPGTRPNCTPRDLGRARAGARACPTCTMGTPPVSPGRARPPRTPRPGRQVPAPGSGAPLQVRLSGVARAGPTVPGHRYGGWPGRAPTTGGCQPVSAPDPARWAEPSSWARHPCTEGTPPEIEPFILQNYVRACR